MSMFQCELPLVVSVPPSVRHERREKPVLRRSSSSVSLLCRLSPVGGAQSAGDGSLEPLSGRTEPKREKGRVTGGSDLWLHAAPCSHSSQRKRRNYRKQEPGKRNTGTKRHKMLGNPPSLLGWMLAPPPQQRCSRPAPRWTGRRTEFVAAERAPVRSQHHHHLHPITSPNVPSAEDTDPAAAVRANHQTGWAPAPAPVRGRTAGLTRSSGHDSKNSFSLDVVDCSFRGFFRRSGHRGRAEPVAGLERSELVSRAALTRSSAVLCRRRFTHREQRLDSLYFPFSPG
ncbi:hypothetical protein Q8A73_011201 [Channa argus]|nr:hypothetical protein Q8A73_011201 [Channa argus]